MVSLFKGITDHSFSEDVCFLCGASICLAERSIEHVIPKWLQQRYDLWNVRVHLLNGTAIRYRDLVIPCCQRCNSIYLSNIEQEVGAAVSAGTEAVIRMDRVVLTQWLLKIFFGFLYRELFLPLDRRQANAETIVSPEDMEQFQMLHYILQSIRVPMQFDCIGSPVPGSIFIFELKEPAELRFQFHYRDDVVHRCLQIRMGKIGILAAFDVGFQAIEGSEFFPKYYGRLLHPIQFDELAANLFCRARVLAINPFLAFAESPRGVTMHVTPPGRSPFAAMKTGDVARMLSHMTGLSLEIISPSPDRRITFLEHDDGSFRDLPIDAPV